MSTGIRIPGEELFFTILAILLSAPFAPHFVDRGQTVAKDLEANSMVSSVGKDTKIIGHKSPGTYRINQVPRQQRLGWVGFTSGLSPLGETVTSDKALLEPIDKGTNQTVWGKARCNPASKGMHLWIVGLASVWNRLTLLQIPKDRSQDMSHVTISSIVLSAIIASKLRNKARCSQKVLLNSCYLNLLAVDGVSSAQVYSIHGELPLTSE
jgi:hypothetical protein